MLRFKSIINTVISVGIGILIVSFLLVFKQEAPLESLYDFFIMPFTNSFYFGNLLDTATLILLSAIAFLIPTKLGFFNLGGEGVCYLSALVSVQFALQFSNMAQPWGIILGCTLAFLISASLGFISAVLKLYFKINELISTYLISAAIIPLLDYAVAEIFRDENGSLLATPYIESSWQLKKFLEPSSLNISIFIVLLIAFAVLIMLNFTRQGYEIKITGDNADFAFSQGIKLPKVFIRTVSLSTGLYGLVGAFIVYGSQHYVYSGITAGLGWSGISAALIGQSNPLGAIFGAFIFAWIDAGSKTSMIHSNFSFDLSSIIQGVIFLLITLNFFRGRKK